MKQPEKSKNIPSLCEQYQVCRPRVMQPNSRQMGKTLCVLQDRCIICNQ